ncbi:MAG: phosphate ABC transporter permease subunit PstC [Bacteroidetes bacterium]|nr:phosphate ABC transporter permease subunit PstC [Bacteroidota bacterium]
MYELPPGLDPQEGKATPPPAVSGGSSEQEVYNPESGSAPGARKDPAAATAAATAPAAEVKNDSASAAAKPGNGSEQEVYNPESGSAPGARKDSSASAAAEHSTGKGNAPAAAVAAAGKDDQEVYNPESGSAPGGTKDSSTAAAAPVAADTSQHAKDSLARLIVGNDYPILEHDSPVKLSYLLYDNWQPNSEHPRYGIYPILLGTLKTTLVALLFACPIAILAALYTAFFAPRRLRETIKPVIEILAGFPSVVLGFFCLMTVASIVQSVFGTEYRLNSVVGGIGLGLAVIPIIYTISEDALRAVPKSLREAALALGATEWEAAYKVMLPAATPGIFAAVLLGLGRAVGETMIALMATGNAGTFSLNFFEPVRTFAATIGAEMGEVVVGSPHYQLLFLLGVILFVFSFGINLVTEFYVKAKLIKKFRGAE